MTQEDEVPSSTAPLVSVEQIQVLNLPQLRVVAFPNNAIKEEAVSLSHEEHTNLVEMSGEKPFLPPLELQPQLPSLTASTGASSPSYTITSGRQTSCMQPPNTPHVPEYLRISPPSTRGSSKGSQGLCNSLDLLSSNTSLPQALEAKPFTPRLPGFEEGSRNDAAISSAFETLKLIGYTSKAVVLQLAVPHTCSLGVVVLRQPYRPQAFQLLKGQEHFRQPRSAIPLMR